MPDINGQNYYAHLSGKEVSFFNAQGGQFGQHWCTKTTSEKQWTAMPDTPSPIDRISELFQRDQEAGKARQIAMLIVGPRQALELYRHGLLTRDHLNPKKVSESRHYLDIPGVAFGRRKLIVRINRYSQHEYATADKNGKVL